MALSSEEQLTYGTIGSDVECRFLDAGRVDEAFGIVTRARTAEDFKSIRMFRQDLDAVYEEYLEKQGETEELTAHLRRTFAQTLSAPCFRKYLKLLPDFDGIEAE